MKNLKIKKKIEKIKFILRKILKNFLKENQHTKNLNEISNLKILI
tara:strand:+ start:984 stop:1118 length:135 start_codon:yes stop_codon:yes gene_type:complete